jgi:pyruvate/2-oxoglutarate dehydrogenase complex dihydrolipoamide dehydrogenase (E3) component
VQQGRIPAFLELRPSREERMPVQLFIAAKGESSCPAKRKCSPSENLRVERTPTSAARIGLNESEPKAKGIDYRKVEIPMSSVLRMRTLSELRGFIKLLIAAETDHILGLTAFGTEGSELLAVVQTAMLGGLPYTTLRDAMFTHPTTAEGPTVVLVRTCQ